MVRKCSPKQIVAEIESDQSGALGEPERDGLVEEVVGKVEVGELRELADGRRDVTGEVEAVKIHRGDQRSGLGASDASPVAVVRGVRGPVG